MCQTDERAPPKIKVFNDQSLQIIRLEKWSIKTKKHDFVSSASEPEAFECDTIKAFHEFRVREKIEPREKMLFLMFALQSTSLADFACTNSFGFELTVSARFDLNLKLNQK